jgi:hypothetical protein
MFMFVLIGISLVLLGIVGLQFTYMFYVDRIFRERKKYLQTLERKHEKTVEQLEAARKRIAEQNEMLETVGKSRRREDEVWADVIE